mgnify:CR=1 FL=1
MGSDIRTDVTMTDRTETPREEVHIANLPLYVYYTWKHERSIFIFLFFQNIGDMDMDFGDARKESIEGSYAMLLQGDENSQHKNVEEVISHNKPKKDANLHVIPQGIF